MSITSAWELFILQKILLNYGKIKINKNSKISKNNVAHALA